MVTSQCVPGPRPLTDHQTPTLRIAPPTGRTPTCTTRYQLLTKSITNLAVVSPKQYFFFCRLNGLKKIKTTNWTVVLITRSQADPPPPKKNPTSITQIVLWQDIVNDFDLFAISAGLLWRNCTLHPRTRPHDWRNRDRCHCCHGNYILYHSVTTWDRLP